MDLSPDRFLGGAEVVDTDSGVAASPISVCAGSVEYVEEFSSLLEHGVGPAQHLSAEPRATDGQCLRGC